MYFALIELPFDLKYYIKMAATKNTKLTIKTEELSSELFQKIKYTEDFKNSSKINHFQIYVIITYVSDFILKLKENKFLEDSIFYLNGYQIKYNLFGDDKSYLCFTVTFMTEEGKYFPKTIVESRVTSKLVMSSLEDIFNGVKAVASKPSVSINSTIKNGSAKFEELAKPTKYAKDFPNFSGGSTKAKKVTGINFAAVAASGTPSVSMPKLITTSEDIESRLNEIEKSIESDEKTLSNLLNTLEDKKGELKTLTKLFEETKAEEERKAKEAELKAKETKAEEAKARLLKMRQLQEELAKLAEAVKQDTEEDTDESETEAKAVAITPEAVATTHESVATTPEAEAKPESSKLRVAKIKVKSPKLVEMKSSSDEKDLSFESIGENPVKENLDEKGYGRYSPSPKTLNFAEDEDDF